MSGSAIKAAVGRLAQAVGSAQNAVIGAIQKIPGWPQIEQTAGLIVRPIKETANAALRLVPALRRVEWLLETERLNKMHPVLLALLLAFVLKRGLNTTSLGHIGTDPLIYPLLSSLSVFNPFMGLISGVTFGIGDLVQKVFVNDIYGTRGRDLNYVGAMVGYVFAYSAVMFAGMFPGISSRLGQFAAREIMRRVIFKRHAAAADGVGPFERPWNIYWRLRADGSRELSVSKDILPGWQISEGPFTWDQAASRMAALGVPGWGAVAPSAAAAAAAPGLNLGTPANQALLANLAQRGLLGDPNAWRGQPGLSPADRQMLAFLRGRGMLGPGAAQQLTGGPASPVGITPDALGNPLTMASPLELLGLVAGGAAGGWAVMQAAPTLVLPAFYFRPEPDVSCHALEATQFGTNRAPLVAGVAGLGGPLGSAALSPVGDLPPTPVASSPPPSDDSAPSGDTIQRLRDQHADNLHDLRQAQQNRQELENTLHGLSPADQDRIRNSAAFGGRLAQVQTQIDDAQAAVQSIDRQLGGWGASTDGGVDRQGDVRTGGVRIEAQHDVDQFRNTRLGDRWSDLVQHGAAGSADSIGALGTFRDRVFRPDGTIDARALDDLSNRLRLSDLAQQQQTADSVARIDASFDQGAPVAAVANVFRHVGPLAAGIVTGGASAALSYGGQLAMSAAVGGFYSGLGSAAGGASARDVAVTTFQGAASGALGHAVMAPVMRVAGGLVQRGVGNLRSWAGSNLPGSLGQPIGRSTAADMVRSLRNVAGRPAPGAGSPLRGMPPVRRPDAAPPWIASGLRNVNPLRGRPGGQINCSYTARATDQLLADTPATIPFPRAVIRPQAAPVFRASQQPDGSWLGSQYPDKAWWRHSNAADIKDTMQILGPGNRGIIVGYYQTPPQTWFQWLTRQAPITPAHAFNVVNRNNRIVFLDGQSGGLASFDGFVDFDLMVTT